MKKVCSKTPEQQSNALGSREGCEVRGTSIAPFSRLDHNAQTRAYDYARSVLCSLSCAGNSLNISATANNKRSSICFFGSSPAPGRRCELAWNTCLRRELSAL